MTEGTIIKGIGGLYYVDAAGECITCRARGKFRRDKILPMIGDRVTIDRKEQGDSVISEILPRKNALIRPAIANLDALMVIVSAAPPVTELFLIDKISAIAGHKGIEALICINKIDLDPAVELERIYTHAGFRVLRVSAETGEGIETVRETLAGRVTALTGNSGVGKSSILNALYPNINASTGEISEKIGRGRHTTRHVELFPVDNGGYIADTPGFSSFDVERMDLVFKSELQNGFIDFAQYIPECRYTGCAHMQEKDCAVKAAVKRGEIEKSRYDSYVMLYNSMKDYKEWEIKRNV